MIYDNELMRHKRTYFRHPKGLLTFQHRAPRRRQVSLFTLMLQQIVYFTKSIHGVSYIWEKDSRFTVRLSWFFVVTGSVIACIAMYMSLTNLHNKHQVKTVVATSQMPLYQVNFPAVALCPWYQVNWSRSKAAEKKFLPPDASENTKAVFHEVLHVLGDMSISSWASLNLLENQTIPRAIDQISLTDLATFMAFRCKEMFVECAYGETKYDCCKIFVAERTERGVCMVFNSMVSEESRKLQITDRFYPWKARKAGQGTGLQFTIRVNENIGRYQRLDFFGLSIMIKECEEWSDSRATCFIPDSKTYLSITPIVRGAALTTRHLDPLTRQCVFEEEKSKYYDHIEGLRFNKINCLVKCQQNNLIRICNCTLSWFFPTIDARECTIADFKCLYENRDIFTYIKSPLQDKYIKDSRRGVTCDCVDSCQSVDYLTSFHVNILPNSNASNPTIQGDIFIGQGVLTKYETRMHSTLFDLIAQFGGILGLCLGASVLSLAEVVYTSLKLILLVLFSKSLWTRKVKPKTRN